MDTVQLKDKTAQTTLNDTDKFYLQQVSGDTVKYAAWSVMRAAAIAGVSTATAKTSNYDITDTDGIRRIEVDTTGGDVTIKMPLIANNSGRRIEIANVKGGTYKVIVAPHATDATKVTGDNLAAVWLPKKGNYIVLQHSPTSGFWESVDEAITSQVVFDTRAGYGSTDTMIMRFTNKTEEAGNLFSHNHDSGYSSNAKGLEITINRSGNYALTFFFNFGAAGDAGLTLNSSALTTAIGGISGATKLTEATAAGVGYRGACSITRYFKKGDVIRPHGTALGTGTPANTGLTCSYVGQ